MPGTWGEVIRAERMRKASARQNGKRWSRAYVAREAGMTATTYGRIEKGGHTQTRKLEDIARVLELDLVISLSDEGLRRSGLSLQSHEPLMDNATHVSGTTRPNDRHLDAAATTKVDEAIGKALIRAAETIRNEAIASALGRAGSALLVEAGTHARQLRSALPSSRSRQPKLRKPRT